LAKRDDTSAMDKAPPLVRTASYANRIWRLRGGADREKIRAFFRHEWIVLVQLERGIGELAQEVVWEHGVRPKDVVHVATAIRLKR